LKGLKQLLKEATKEWKEATRELKEVWVDFTYR
jgi:hypothetical protein